MTKRRKKNTKAKLSGGMIALIVLIAAVAVILACMIGSVLSGGSPQTAQPKESSAPTETSAATTVPGVQQDSAQTPGITAPTEATEPDDRLPYLMEDGKLEIESVFQYTGLNPDSFWEDGRDIGSVVLTNKSEEYLESLDLTLTLTDGTRLQFVIRDIPAGKTVWAYDTENTTIAADVALADVEYTAKFRQDSGMTSDQVTVSVSGMDITLVNVSDSELSGMEIRCHNTVDDVFFGGTVYVYPVETLGVGEEVIVSAWDCFLGEAGLAIIDYAK